jgi:hypothetical protein
MAQKRRSFLFFLVVIFFCSVLGGIYGPKVQAAATVGGASGPELTFLVDIHGPSGMMSSMTPNMLGAYGDWAAQSLVDPLRLSFGQPMFKP